MHFEGFILCTLLVSDMDDSESKEEAASTENSLNMDVSALPEQTAIVTLYLMNVMMKERNEDPTTPRSTFFRERDILDPAPNSMFSDRYISGIEKFQ